MNYNLERNILLCEVGNKNKRVRPMEVIFNDCWCELCMPVEARKAIWLCEY